MDKFIQASSINIFRFSSGAAASPFNSLSFRSNNNNYGMNTNIQDSKKNNASTFNKEKICNKNFFDIFKFFNKTDRNPEHHLSYYHSSGTKVHVVYYVDITDMPNVFMKLEGDHFNSIFIELDKSDSILDITNVNNTSSRIVLNILKNMEGITLLAEVFGINICVNPLELLDEIKKYNISKIKIEKDVSIMSDRSILIGKNIFDVLKFITPHQTTYPFMHLIYVVYEPDNIFPSMVRFGIGKCKPIVSMCDKQPKWKTSGPPYVSYLDQKSDESVLTPRLICINISLDDNNNIEDIVSDYSNNPFGAEFILNQMKNIEGIPLIAEALGVKMDYTENEIIKMRDNY